MRRIPIPTTKRTSLVVPPGAPADLNPVEASKWAELVGRYPWLAVDHPDELRMYVALWSDWVTARQRLAQTGTAYKDDKGRVRRAPWVNDAREAREGLMAMQRSVLFEGTQDEGTPAPAVKAPSKLDQFLEQQRANRERTRRDIAKLVKRRKGEEAKHQVSDRPSDAA